MDHMGAKWTREEDRRLLEELADGKTTIEMALLHGRTTGSISARPGTIATKIFSIDEIITRYNETSEKEFKTRNNINKQMDLARLKTYISSQLNPVGLPNPGNAYDPFLGHHYYFKISKPDETNQKDAAFLHAYVSDFGHMRFCEIMSCTGQ